MEIEDPWGKHVSLRTLSDMKWEWLHHTVDTTAWVVSASTPAASP